MDHIAVDIQVMDFASARSQSEPETIKALTSHVKSQFAMLSTRIPFRVPISWRYAFYTDTKCTLMYPVHFIQISNNKLTHATKGWENCRIHLNKDQWML